MYLSHITQYTIQNRRKHCVYEHLKSVLMEDECSFILWRQHRGHSIELVPILFWHNFYKDQVEVFFLILAIRTAWHYYILNDYRIAYSTCTTIIYKYLHAEPSWVTYSISNEMWALSRDRLSNNWSSMYCKCILLLHCAYLCFTMMVYGGIYL